MDGPGGQEKKEPGRQSETEINAGRNDTDAPVFTSPINPSNSESPMNSFSENRSSFRCSTASGKKLETSIAGNPESSFDVARSNERVPLNDDKRTIVPVTYQTSQIQTSKSERDVMETENRKVGTELVDRNDSSVTLGAPESSRIYSLGKSMKEIVESTPMHAQDSTCPPIIAREKRNYLATVNSIPDCGNNSSLFLSAQRASSNISNFKNSEILARNGDLVISSPNASLNPEKMTENTPQTLDSSKLVNLYRQPQQKLLKIAQVPFSSKVKNSVHRSQRKIQQAIVNNSQTPLSTKLVKESKGAHQQRPRSNSEQFTSTPTHANVGIDRKPSLTTPWTGSTKQALNNNLLPTSTLRRGKWTVEEETFVARVIKDFNSGYLNSPAGTTLRTFLSAKLHCDPMRITKKFTGGSCIGKRVFHPAVRCASNADAIDRSQSELELLEKRWRRRLEMQQREASKKAAASANAIAGKQFPFVAHSFPQVIGNHAVQSTPSTSQTQRQHILVKTAAWLDRTSNILSRRLSPSEAVENEIDEVRQLICEGPSVQKTSAGLPRLLDEDSVSSLSFESHHKVLAPRKTNGFPTAPVSPLKPMQKIPEVTTVVINSVDTDSFPITLTNTTLQTGIIKNNDHHVDNSMLSSNGATNSATQEYNQHRQHIGKMPKRSLSTNYLLTMAALAAEAPPSSCTAGAEDAEALVGFLNSVRRESSCKAGTATDINR